MIGFAVVSARWLGPAGKGELAMVTTAGIVASALVGLGVPQALTTRVSQQRLAVDQGLYLGLGWAVVLGAVAALAAGAIGNTSLALRLLWLSVGSAMLDQVMQAVAVGSGNLRPTLVYRLMGGLLQVSFMVVAVTIGLRPDPELAAYVLYGITVGSVAVTVGLLLKSHDNRSAPRIPLSGVRQTMGGLVGFGIATVPAQLLTIANSRADLLVLGVVSGTVAVGVYSLAASATLLVGLLPAAIGQALTSTFGGEQEATERLRIGFQSALIAGALLALLLAVLSPTLVPLAFGREFAQASGLIVMMVPFTAFFSTVQVSYPFFYSRLNRPITHSVIIGSTAAVDILLVLVLAPHYGALGAAVASAIAYGVGGMVNVVLTARGAKLSVRQLIVPDREIMGKIASSGRAVLFARGGR